MHSLTHITILETLLNGVQDKEFDTKMFLAKIYISIKSSVNDPEGITIQSSLSQLGFESVTSVRSGKYIEIKISEKDKKVAEKKIEEMCDKLLSNPVIETYTFDLDIL